MAVTFPLVASILAAFCKWQSLELCRLTKDVRQEPYGESLGREVSAKTLKSLTVSFRTNMDELEEEENGQNIVGF